MNNPAQQLQELGQSPWLDNISFGGTLAKYSMIWRGATRL